MIAAVGTNGLRPVVWGLGVTIQDAREDAYGYSVGPIRLVFVEIDEAQRARVCAGEVDCERLGINLTKQQLAKLNEV